MRRLIATYHGTHSNSAGFGVVFHDQIHPGYYNWGHSCTDSDDVKGSDWGICISIDSARNVALRKARIGDDSLTVQRQ